MNIEKALTRAVLAAQGVKQEAVARGEEMQFFLQPWRGMDPVGLVSLQGDRDLMLHAAELCARGFGADLISLATDAFMATDPVDPSTGRTWEPGALAVAMQSGDGPRRAAVSEALIISAHNRAGDSAVRIETYTLAQGAVRWTGRLSMPEGTMVAGLIEQRMQRVMAGPSVEQDLGRAGTVIASERDRAAADFATVRALRRALGRQGVVILHAKAGTDRHRYLEYRMGDHLLLV